MDDPCGDEAIIDPWYHGGFVKGTDKKLYYPTGAGGYARIKRFITKTTTTYAATTDDTPVTFSIATSPTDGSAEAHYFLMAYQNSGGDLALNFWNEVGKTNILFTQTIPTATWTLLNIATLPFGTAYVAWAGAAGAIQRITYSRKVWILCTDNS